MPLLTCKDAARLGRTCKALSGVARESFKDLGQVELKNLQAALTSFPKARSTRLCHGRSQGWGIAALGLMRRVHTLVKLEIVVFSSERLADDPSKLPPFIPPSLKALHIVIKEGAAMGEPLLCALPGVLGASGAGLDRLEVTFTRSLFHSGDQLIDVALALRCCSATLRVFRLAIITPESRHTPLVGFGDAGEAAKRERLACSGRTCCEPYLPAASSRCWPSRQSRSSPCFRPALPSPASPTSRFATTSNSICPVPV
jgi:hypothetical protein